MRNSIRRGWVVIHLIGNLENFQHQLTLSGMRATGIPWVHILSSFSELINKHEGEFINLMDVGGSHNRDWVGGKQKICLIS